jgi:hypothetical protein
VKHLTGNFYYSLQNNSIDIYEKVEGVSWHRFQGISFKEPHDSFGKLLYSLIYDKENL